MVEIAFIYELAIYVARFKFCNVVRPGKVSCESMIGYTAGLGEWYIYWYRSKYLFYTCIYGSIPCVGVAVFWDDAVIALDDVLGSMHCKYEYSGE
jgi:hypothetical protein